MAHGKKNNHGHEERDDIHGEVTQGNEGHEVRDVLFRPILITGAALFITLFVVMAITFGVYAWNANRLASRDTGLPPLAVVDQTPPEPRLQPSNNADLIAMDAEFDEILDGYRWVNQQQGRVQIPIERAMELLTAPGRVPVRQGATALPMPIKDYGQINNDGDGGQPPMEATAQP